MRLMVGTWKSARDQVRGFEEQTNQESFLTETLMPCPPSGDHPHLLQLKGPAQRAGQLSVPSETMDRCKAHLP